MKYWIAFKLFSYLVEFFANRGDNKMTKEVAEFLTTTLDKARPTDLRAWKSLERELRAK